MAKSHAAGGGHNQEGLSPNAAAEATQAAASEAAKAATAATRRIARKLRTATQRRAKAAAFV
jgi:hypothetical protein